MWSGAALIGNSTENPNHATLMATLQRGRVALNHQFHGSDYGFRTCDRQPATIHTIFRPRVSWAEGQIRQSLAARLSPSLC
jgi:hypothetical protein